MAAGHRSRACTPRGRACAGVRVLGFSLVTNKATEDVETGATHAEVIEMGKVGAERLVRLLADLLPRLA